MTQRPATIHDVAREAGVSTSTVSRMLDERLPPSRSATAERVRNAALKLGYRRDVYASALRRQHTGTIGVLVPRLSDTVMAILFTVVPPVEVRTLVHRATFAPSEPSRRLHDERNGCSYSVNTSRCMRRTRRSSYT